MSQRLTQTLGDTVQHLIPLKWKGRRFTPGSEWVLLFTLKAALSDADADAKIQKETGTGLVHSGDDALVTLISVDTLGNPDASPEPTVALLASTYYWGILAQRVSDGARRTVASGTMEFDPAPTIEAEPSIPIYTTEPPNPYDVTGSIDSAPALDPVTGAEKIGAVLAGVLSSITLTAIKDWVFTFLGTAATKNTGTTNGTIPLIGAGDKLPASVIPVIDIVDSLLVANQAARLALSLSAAQGCAVVEADSGKSWMLVSGGVPATEADWLQLGDRAIAAGDVSGLGGAALLSVGTTTGTVAAGDHTHLSADITDATADGNAYPEKVLKTDEFGVLRTTGIRATDAIQVGSPSVYAQIAATNVTAPRVQELPDKDGTVAMTSDITGTNSGTNTGDNANSTGSTATNLTLAGSLTSGALTTDATTKTNLRNAAGLGVADSPTFAGVTLASEQAIISAYGEGWQVANQQGYALRFSGVGLWCSHALDIGSAANPWGNTFITNLTASATVTADTFAIGGADAPEIAANKATTRTNLGLGTAATTDATTYATDGVIYDAGTFAANVQLNRNNGLYQKALLGVGNATPTLLPPTGGDEAETLTVRIKVDAGGDSTLAFDAAILIPSDFYGTLPKVLTAGLTYKIKLEHNGTAWELQALVGGYP